MNKNHKFVAPDGGWGWIVLFVFVINGVFTMGMQINFGLLFKDTFKLLDLSGTSVASIISTNTAVGYLVGVCTGPLLKRFGIRVVATVASILFTFGVTTMAFTNSYIQFLICYGIVIGLGMGTMQLTTRLSVNSYFLKKRRKVVGVGFAMKSIGFIFFPHFVTSLLSYYGITGAMLLIGGIFANTVCTSLLLRPVEWYMKAVEANSSEQDAVSPLNKKVEVEGARAESSPTIIKRFIKLYDLTLLTNRVFLSIMCGVSFSDAADQIFNNYLFTFILSDLGFQSAEIATFLSTSFTTSIIVRFTCPFIGDYFQRSTRFMYGFGCLVITVGRFVIIYFSKTTRSVAIPLLWGVAVGVRIVYQHVIFADNISPEKLSSAESIFMVFNGIINLVCGPLIGWIKDVTGTYVSCVYVANALTFLAPALWSVENICTRIKQWRMLMVLGKEEVL